MSLLVTGTVALDSIKTPFGARTDCLGDSATYFSIAASHFTPVRLVGAVGDDFPESFLEVFRGRPIDLAGLERRAGSKTFRWSGAYEGNMDQARTLQTQLNILAEAPPTIPPGFRASRFVFLANTAPQVQMHLLEQLEKPALVVADTMNYWIQNTRAELDRLIRRLNALILNDAEARLLTGRANLLAAAGELVERGLDFVVLKKGEHGALLRARGRRPFLLPAYPTAAVKDPTGAGDSFAGGMMGYLAAHGDCSWPRLQTALAYGTCVASLVIEGFSLDRWQSAGRADIDRRLQELQEMVNFSL